jgi:ribosome-associated protein
MQESAAKKDTAKLQRVIIDGLEDVKAQDIVVFDTEHLSALFERVIIASGTSNRQTKALAASVRDAVREAGFVKPRVEGEDNGEWIIVDCGQCVVHVMQPAIRTYYHLEEIWGEKPVRLKLGAPKPAQPARAEAAPLTPAKKAATKKAGAKNAGAAKAPAAKSTTAKKAAPAKAPAKSPVKVPAKKAASKTVAKPATKTVAKPAAKKPASKTAPAKRSRA